MASTNNKRIAKNTLMLYFRQILIVLVSLYTVRVVLNTLGVEDYGIYNVVAGVVTMFSFLSGAMATASQRFFAFELGKGNLEKLKKTFGVTLCIYLLLIILIVFLAETIGLWFISNKLVVPMERLIAAQWIYQFSILSFAVTLITTPYMASIIAHENMKVYAYVSIVEVGLKLAIVFLLQILPADKLIVYGILIFAVSFINTALYRFYCKKHYKECVFKPEWDKGMFGETIGFTGWSLFGTFTTVVKTQAVTIMINQFFNPVVVAARVISNQVTSVLTVFSSNFNTSLYSPIVKEYAAGHKDKMYSLIYNGCKMTFFLMWIFALPLYLHMDFVLTLWLKKLPEYLLLFSQLSLIAVLIQSVSYPLMTAARAQGNVRLYESTLGTLQLLMFIASWIWIKYFNGQAVVVFYTEIALNLVMFLTRLLIVKKMVGLSLIQYSSKVIVPAFFIMVFSAVPSVALFIEMPRTFFFRIINCTVCFCLSSILMFFFGLSKDMRTKILNRIKNGICFFNL
jgi:O-antigen/teichoic acid export membrane protein